MNPFAMMQGLQSLLPQTQVGAPAPAPQLGGAGLLGQNTMQRQMDPQAITPPDFNSLLGQQEMGPPAPTVNQMGPPDPQSDPLAQGGFGMPEGFGGFFGNIDKTLQSPSKVIGLGLLNRIAPGAGLVGLLGSGFYNG